MRPSLAFAGLALVALAAYLTLAPIPADPRRWEARPDAGFSGDFAPNTALSQLSVATLGGEHGPESGVLHDGWVYTGLASGAVVRVRADAGPGTEAENLLSTGGRPLGLAFDGQGRLLIADGITGLLRATADSNGVWSIEPLVTQVDEPEAGDPVRYANAVVFGADGIIYFTDSSRRFAPREWGGTFEASVLDMVEQSCTGRVLAYDSTLKQTHVVMQDLCFANGLAASADGRALFVAESGRFRIWRINPGREGGGPLSGTQMQPSARARVIVDNLPGYPDNLTRGEAGRIWCGLVKPRGAAAEMAHTRPWLRSMMLRLPRMLWPVPRQYSAVFAFDEEGRITANLQDPAGTYPETTGVTEAGGRLFVQSLAADRLGWVERRAAGL